MTNTRRLPSLKKISLGLAGLAFTLGLFFAQVPAAHAASLSEAQIQAMIGLLQSFGVNNTTISSVNNILRGGSGSNVNVNTSGGSSYTNSSGSSAARATVKSDDYETENPRITGTAKGVTRIELIIGDGRYYVYESGLIRVPSSGKWSHKVEEDLDEGTYDVFITTQDGYRLAQGTIEIELDEDEDDEDDDRVSFRASPTSGKAPLEVEFESNKGSSIEFGDGESEWFQYCLSLDCNREGFEIEHTYRSAGAYTAKVRDAENRTIATKNILVTSNPQSSVTLSATPASGAAPLTVGFRVSGSASVYYNDGYFITFGDGQQASVSIVAQALCFSIMTACNPNVYGAPHTYTVAGTYTARLHEPLDGEVVASKTVTVTGTGAMAPAAPVAVAPQAPQAPMPPMMAAAGRSEAPDFAGLLVAAAAAPYEALVDIFEDVFVALGFN